MGCLLAYLGHEKKAGETRMMMTMQLPGLRDSKKDYFALVEEESELRSSKKQLGKCSIVGFFNQDIALRPAVREKANYLSN